MRRFNFLIYIPASSKSPGGGPEATSGFWGEGGGGGGGVGGVM